MINRPILVRFGRFLLVGIANTGIHYVIFLLLFRLFDIHYLLASVIGYCCGLVNSFILNKLWTFEVSRSWSKMEVAKFIVVNFASLLANLSSLRLFVLYFSIAPEFAQIVAIVTSTVVNFLGSYYWTFRQASRRGGISGAEGAVR